MGNVLSFINSKGGVGKSTLTTLVAGNIHVNHNPERDKDMVMVLDLDHPQHSVMDTRNREYEIVVNKEKENNLYYTKLYAKMYRDGLQPYAIRTDRLSRVSKRVFDQMKRSHELVFVDMPGATDIEGYSQEMLSNMDYLIVPFNTNYVEFGAGMKFVGSIVHPMVKAGLMKDYRILINNLDTREIETDRQMIEDIRSAGFKVMGTVMKRARKYGRPYLVSERRGALSTIFFQYDRTIHQISKEILEMIDHKQEQQ